MQDMLDIQVKEKQLPNRVIGLDLLRIALALLIYMFHSWMHFECHYSYLNKFRVSGSYCNDRFFHVIRIFYVSSLWENKSNG